MEVTKMYQPHDFKEAEANSRRREYQLGKAIPKSARLDHNCLEKLLAREKLVPDLIRYKNYVLWDGCTARDGLKREIVLVGGLRKEMRRMLLTGKFGPIPNLWINSPLWWLCRDELRWPDRNSAENIKRFQIIEVPVAMV
jgi:hypothetical protein